MAMILKGLEKLSNVATKQFQHFIAYSALRNSQEILQDQTKTKRTGTYANHLTACEKPPV